jgi:hypothetical protein
MSPMPCHVTAFIGVELLVWWVPRGRHDETMGVSIPNCTGGASGP